MASMSQLADDFFTCTLCVEKFRDPRTLPCLHTFCKSCLSVYIRQTMDKGVFKCPLCGQNTRSEVTGLSVDQWMETFVSNGFITSLQKITETRNSEKACDICKQEHVLIEASSWCRECLEALCEDCERVHGRSKASRDHHVFGMEYLENEALEKLLRPRKGQLMCTEHKGKQLLLACLNCKKFVCESCIAVGHSSCKKIQPAEKVVVELKNDVALSRDRVKAFRKAAQDLSRTCQENLESLTKSRDAALEDINEYVQTLIQIMLEKQKKMMTDVESLYEKQREHFEERALSGDVRVNSLSKAERFLDKLLQYGSDVDVLNNFDFINNQVLFINKQPVVNHAQDTTTMTFTPDKKVKDGLKSLSSLGDLKLAKKGKKTEKATTDRKLTLPVLPKQPSTARERSPRKTPSSVKSTPRTRLVSTFTGRSKQDTMRTDLRGILLLKSGDVVVMDIHFRNKRLKKFTARGKQVSETDIGECPHSIALVSPTEAVVTLPKSREFAFVTVGGTLHVTGKIKTQKSYFSLASSSEDVIASVGLSPPDLLSIDVISCSGEILHSIALDRVSFPRAPVDLTLSPSGDILLLCPNKNMLTCINMSGDTLYVFSPTKALDIRAPVAVTTDNQGRTLLVERSSSTVHVISGDGLHQGALLSRRDGLREPLAATVGDSGVLALTQSNGDVKLFAIK